MEAIKVMSVRDQVVNILRESILTNEFKANERLDLDSLSKKMGVSITPIREALQILEQEGLIQMKPRKGAIVCSIDADYVRDYYMVRIALECAAAQFACEGDSDLSEIEASFKQMQEVIQKKDSKNYAQQNYLFHKAIWEAAGSARLENMLKSVWISRSLGVSYDVEENAQVSFHEHEKILKAILNRDGKLAYDMMRKHLERSMKDVMTHYE